MISVQSQVEQPEIYLLSAGTSTVEDQATLIADCFDCLSDLSTPIETNTEYKSQTDYVFSPVIILPPNLSKEQSREGHISVGHVGVRKICLTTKHTL